MKTAIKLHYGKKQKKLLRSLAAGALTVGAPSSKVPYEALQGSLHKGNCQEDLLEHVDENKKYLFKQ